MPRSLLKPALFFDFDNTLTHGDVLDELIERYSPNEAWRDWEEAWQQGRLSARKCLRLQVENMRVSRERLLADVARVRIDPVFAEIVDWAARHDVPVQIVSDSFLPLIARILDANGIAGIRVFANDLDFAAGDRLVPSFPHYDPRSACAANAKAHHLAPYRASYRIIFAGDGHSDVDAALAADVVFAKSTLANELDARGVAFYPFDTLEPVLAFLETVTLLDAERTLDETNPLAAK
ncbi:MAG TPA: MtnX-like HAD-IB family phosphatase [Burkholderiales bacterium]|nr:MtnX-like HAD-IB family phosphatase [Burkholderiales bacterium]